MTDEKLDLLLRDALQPDELPPELDLKVKKKPARSKVPGILAACACLAVCAAAYFTLAPSFTGSTGTTESAAMVMDTAESSKEQIDAVMADSASAETAETAEETADATETTAMVPAMGGDLCAYPKNGVEAVADQWMQTNALGAAYEMIAESERYTSFRAELSEEEVLYLVIDKETMEPVSLEQLLERGKFAVNAQQVDMLYVNQNQELILVQGSGEVNLGPIE